MPQRHKCGIGLGTEWVVNFVTGGAEAMALFARDTILRVRIGEAARQRVQERFVWEETAALYEKASANK